MIVYGLVAILMLASTSSWLVGLIMGSALQQMSETKRQKVLEDKTTSKHKSWGKS